MCSFLFSGSSSHCLNDKPTSHTVSSDNHNKLPGQLFDGDAQCALQMGAGYRSCKQKQVHVKIINVGILPAVIHTHIHTLFTVFFRPPQLGSTDRITLPLEFLVLTITFLFQFTQSECGSLYCSPDGILCTSYIAPPADGTKCGERMVSTLKRYYVDLSKSITVFVLV